MSGFVLLRVEPYKSYGTSRAVAGFGRYCEFSQIRSRYSPLVRPMTFGYLANHLCDGVVSCVAEEEKRTSPKVTSHSSSEVVEVISNEAQAIPHKVRCQLLPDAKISWCARNSLVRDCHFSTDSLC